jgi:MarR family transcriptional regulator, transcriptional regulator for hemolysin
MRDLDVQPTLGSLLKDIGRLLRKRSEQRARDCGLSRSQWPDRLSLEEPRRPSGWCRRIAGDRPDHPRAHPRWTREAPPKSSVGNIADRRAWLLFLNEAAHPLLLASEPLGEATRVDALSGVSEADRDRMSVTVGVDTGHARGLPDSANKLLGRDEKTHD